MKTISFQVSNKKNISDIIEVIKQHGFEPKIRVAETVKNKKLKVIELANSIKERKLSLNQIDELIACERNVAK